MSTKKYRNTKESKDGRFSAHIDKEVTTLLTIYCKINGIEKTKFVNTVLKEELTKRFQKLREDNGSKENVHQLQIL